MAAYDRYRTYTIRVMAEPGDRLHPEDEDELSTALSRAEELLDEALPEGFYVKIEEDS
jgi:hypothetical protein